MSADGFYQPYPAEPYLPGRTGLCTTKTAPEDNFKDSGYFEGQNHPSSHSPIQPYDDFVLYDCDPPFVDDEASLIPNHGSIYNGTRDSSSDHIPKYTSYNPSPNHDASDDRLMDQGSHAGSQNYVYRSTQLDRPSLFGEFEQVPATGPSPLHEWIVSPYRHEQLGVRYESLPLFREGADSIRLTPEPASPPRSPKPRKSKSGSSKSQRRRKQ